MAVRALVQQCSRPLPEVAGIKATQLFARNADVDAVNRRELQVLPGDLVRREPISPPGQAALENTLALSPAVAQVEMWSFEVPHRQSQACLCIPALQVM